MSVGRKTERRARGPVASESKSLSTLLQGYGCGPVKFTGTSDALYERHLLFRRASAAAPAPTSRTPTMHARKMLGSSTAATISSRRAFVLPQLVGIASGSEGLVTRLFVKERDEIRRGQDLLEIEWRRPQVDGGVAAAAQEASPSEPGRTDGALADASQRLRLKASVTGVVSRCHVKVGDVVRRRSPVVSMLRADDVLVIARFDAAAGPRLRRDRTAWVHLPRAGAYCMPARIIRVGGTEPSQADPWAPREAGAVLVVAQLSSVTFDALSPGVEATVEVSGFDEAA